MTQNAPLILAADIGGTNTRVALLDGTALRSDTVKRYANETSSGLEDILRDYLASQDVRTPDAVSLALAGPIDGDAGRLTNLDWAITTNGASLASGGAMGVLLNDLQAQGHALPFLAQSSFKTIQNAPQRSDAPCLVIGLGTGLNVAPVHRQAARTYVPAAEAGHINFAPQDAELVALGADLRERLGHVAAEDILSGRGLERAYRHCAGQDLPAVEVMALCAKGDSTAQRAIALVVRTLGHFAGDLALIHLPRGGIYLVGGVARALVPYFESSGFAECFAAKGRFSGFMSQFSIHVLEDDYAALIGAASYAQECLSAR
ncbi:MAG: ROK family protein [Planktotalea sp.]|uniref:glucokinase n=1 Tax=Planktotalea sp. TaxID=2029877 RepID=UPI003C795603